jgi:hypothetical protein
MDSGLPHNRLVALGASGFHSLMSLCSPQQRLSQFNFLRFLASAYLSPPSHLRTDETDDRTERMGRLLRVRECDEAGQALREAEEVVAETMKGATAAQGYLIGVQWGPRGSRYQTAGGNTMGTTPSKSEIVRASRFA